MAKTLHELINSIADNQEKPKKKDLEQMVHYFGDLKAILDDVEEGLAALRIVGKTDQNSTVRAQIEQDKLDKLSKARKLLRKHVG